MSEEAIHQIWSRYSKDLSRYTHLVPSSLLFDTPLRHVVFSQYQTKRSSPLSQVDYLWSKATAHKIWTKYSHNFYSGGTTFIHVLSFHYSKFHITIRTTPPPPPRGPLNKINNGYDTIFFLLRVDHQVSEEAIHQIWSRYLKDLSRYTHLVPSSLLFDTPLRHVVFSQFQTKHGSPLSQVD